MGWKRKRDRELACARVFCYFDLSLVPKRRMRLISWLAFGSFCAYFFFFRGLFLSLGWASREGVLGGCRAMVSKVWLQRLAIHSPTSARRLPRLSFKSYHHRRHKNNEVCGCGRLAFGQVWPGLQSSVFGLRSWLFAINPGLDFSPIRRLTGRSGRLSTVERCYVCRLPSRV